MRPLLVATVGILATRVGNLATTAGILATTAGLGCNSTRLATMNIIKITYLTFTIRFASNLVVGVSETHSAKGADGTVVMVWFWERDILVLQMNDSEEKGIREADLVNEK